MSVIVADTLKSRVAGAAVTFTKGLNVGGACTATSFVGDVTGDGIINVLDIIGLVNHILGMQIQDDVCAADYTQDGIVNVLDISLAKKYGWKPKINLDAAILKTYKDYLTKK